MLIDHDPGIGLGRRDRKRVDQTRRYFTLLEPELRPAAELVGGAPPRSPRQCCGTPEKRYRRSEPLIGYRSWDRAYDPADEREKHASR